MDTRRHEYEIEFYVADNGKCPMDEFLDGLIPKQRAKVERWFEQLEIYGPNLPRPYADMLVSPIRELRIQFGNLNFRVLYFIHRKIVLLTHGILKKTGPVMQNEIDRAMRYMNDWLVRKGG